MKKLIFAIFAHPDDESFGPCGTLIKEIRENDSDVHLITLTAGEKGANPDNLPDLGAARLSEWQAAGQLIGATSQHHLGYIDGELSNSAYLEIAERIKSIIDQTAAKYIQPIEIELMSNDTNGITGHIDHIVAARVSCFLFYSHKPSDGRFSRLRLVCMPDKLAPSASTKWLYMDAGRQSSEIDEFIDASQYHDYIAAVMRCHKTQRADCEAHLSARGDTIGHDYFIVLS